MLEDRSRARRWILSTRYPDERLDPFSSWRATIFVDRRAVPDRLPPCIFRGWKSDRACWLVKNPYPIDANTPSRKCRMSLPDRRSGIVPLRKPGPVEGCSGAFAPIFSFFLPCISPSFLPGLFHTTSGQCETLSPKNFGDVLGTLGEKEHNVRVHF